MKPSRTVFVDITDGTPERLRLGLEQMAEGHAVSCDGVGFAVIGGVLQVSTSTQWSPQNVTDALARREIERARQICNFLTESSPEFRARLFSVPRRYSIVHDDGVSAVEICHLEGDTLVWT